MPVIDSPVALPKLAFITAWGMLDLGDPHAVLGTNHHYWMNDDVKRQLHNRSMELLAVQGLARRERLNGLWRDTLTVLGTADREYFAWSAFESGPSGAMLVAARGNDAVRLVVDDNMVLIQPVKAKWLATSLYDALPEVDGAPIRPIAVPKAFYDEPHAAPADPLAPPVDTSDVEYIKRLLKAPQEAVHQLYAATRDGQGYRRSLPITALDLTDQGRMLTYLTADDEIRVVSGTHQEFVRALNATHDGL